MEEKKIQELNEEELEKVNGGYNWSPEDVTFKYWVGKHVELIWSTGWLSGHEYTYGSTITDRGVCREVMGYAGAVVYHPCYYVKVNDSDHDDDSGWYQEDKWDNDYKVTPVRTGM